MKQPKNNTLENEVIKTSYLVFVSILPGNYGTMHSIKRWTWVAALASNSSLLI